MKFIFFILLLVGMLSGCESLTKNFLKDPEVKIIDVKITDISLSEISVAVKLNVINPNGIPLNLDKVNYELNISGETVTEGTFTEGMQIPASGQNDLSIPLKFRLKSVGNILSGLMNRSFTKEYELKGNVQLGIFTLPFSKRGEINLNQ